MSINQLTGPFEFLDQNLCVEQNLAELEQVYNNPQYSWNGETSEINNVLLSVVTAMIQKFD